MPSFRRPIPRRALFLLPAILLAGCAAVFNAREAHEVSREKLLQLADAGHADHLEYRGSDRNWHYAFDNRPDRLKSYKVRTDQVELEERFPVGEDSYVLHPWLIEGKRMGKKPQ